MLYETVSEQTENDNVRMCCASVVINHCYTYVFSLDDKGDVSLKRIPMNILD